MKVYAEKLGSLTALSSVLGGSVSLVFRDWLLGLFQLRLLQIGALCAPVVASLILLYLVNLSMILLTSPVELRRRMSERWRVCLQEDCPPEALGRVDDLVDRVAVLLVWIKFHLLGAGDARAGYAALPGSLSEAKIAMENDRLRGELARLKRDTLGNATEMLGSVWKRERGPSWRRNPAFFEDPIYGQVELDRSLYPIFFHPLFQRLNYVRQLSFAYLNFPSASHTRLSHILGVMRNAKVAMEGIFGRGVTYPWNSTEPRRMEVGRQESERLVLKAQLCALLHDVGHGPFGHAFDALIPHLDAGGATDLPDKTFSIIYTADVFEGALREVGFTVDEVLMVLDKERRTELDGYDVFISDIIDSALDVDRMDYLVRDAHMTGIGIGDLNVEALIHQMRPFLDENGSICLTYDRSALPHMENLLYIRNAMYINCYEHARKVCAEKLLIRLGQFLLQQGIAKESLMLLTDEQLLTQLTWLLEADVGTRNCLRSIQENRDFAPVATYRLSKWDEAKNRPAFNDELNEEIEAWYRNRLNKKQRKSTFLDLPQLWESRICDEAQISTGDRWKVVVTVPALDAKQQKESGASILRLNAGGYGAEDLFTASPVIKAIITNLIPAREVIRVFVSEEFDERLTSEVKQAADRVFRRR
jgi:HD superfamily phosphohydrolase